MEEYRCDIIPGNTAVISPVHRQCQWRRWYWCWTTRHSLRRRNQLTTLQIVSCQSKLWRVAIDCRLIRGTMTWYDMTLIENPVDNADVLSPDHLDTQSSPMMLVRSCGLIGRCYVWKERFIRVMSLKVRETNRERCGSPSTSCLVKPSPASLPITSTASSSTGREDSLLYCLCSGAIIQCSATWLHVWILSVNWPWWRHQTDHVLL